MDGRNIPALGMAWSACVNSRIMLTRQARVHAGAETTERSMFVVFSPFAAIGCLRVDVNSAGMTGLDHTSGSQALPLDDLAYHEQLRDDDGDGDVRVGGHAGPGFGNGKGASARA